MDNQTLIKSNQWSTPNFYCNQVLKFKQPLKLIVTLNWALLSSFLCQEVTQDLVSYDGLEIFHKKRIILLLAWSWWERVLPLTFWNSPTVVVPEQVFVCAWGVVSHWWENSIPAIYRLSLFSGLRGLFSWELWYSSASRTSDISNFCLIRIDTISVVFPKNIIKALLLDKNYMDINNIVIIIILISYCHYYKWLNVII